MGGEVYLLRGRKGKAKNPPPAPPCREGRKKPIHLAHVGVVSMLFSPPCREGPGVGSALEHISTKFPKSHLTPENKRAEI
jgi:hypothetical protein